MKAAVVCANEDVRYMDYEEPQVTPGTVKVKVKASGICGFIRSYWDMSFPAMW